MTTKLLCQGCHLPQAQNNINRHYKVCPRYYMLVWTVIEEMRAKMQMMVRKMEHFHSIKSHQLDQNFPKIEGQSKIHRIGRIDDLWDAEYRFIACLGVTGLNFLKNRDIHLKAVLMRIRQQHIDQIPLKERYLPTLHRLNFLTQNESDSWIQKTHPLQLFHTIPVELEGSGIPQSELRKIFSHQILPLELIQYKPIN